MKFLDGVGKDNVRLGRGISDQIDPQSSSMVQTCNEPLPTLNEHQARLLINESVP
jgi:hypothetical protein